MIAELHFHYEKEALVFTPQLRFSIMKTAAYESYFSLTI